MYFIIQFMILAVPSLNGVLKLSVERLQHQVCHHHFISKHNEWYVHLHQKVILQVMKSESMH